MGGVINMESSQLINSQASSLELKLNSMIEELRQSSGEMKDTQYHNKQIRETFNQLKAKIKVCVYCVYVCMYIYIYIYIIYMYYVHVYDLH